MSIELNPMKRNHLVIRVTNIALFTSNIGTNERLQFVRQFNQISAAASSPPRLKGPFRFPFQANGSTKQRLHQIISLMDCC